MPLSHLLPVVVLILAASLPGQQTKPPTPPPEPPEEDESLAKKEYAFNPIQAANEVKVGDYYFKKGNFRAAISRYKEALLWNQGCADAWRRLGDAHDKMKDPAAAREAWKKYVEIEPDGKYAAKLRRKLARKR